MLEETARLICDRANRRPIFAVGSSGLTHGLLLHWSALGLIPPAKPPAPAQRVDRLLVLSGSCSPITANQIRHATKSGFATLHLQGPAPWRVQATRTLESLARGQSVVLYTALGPQAKDKEHGEYFGRALGTLLRRLVLESGVRRVLIAGGDTSTHAVKQLDLRRTHFCRTACRRRAALPCPRTRFATSTGSNSRSRAARSAPKISSPTCAMAAPGSADHRRCLHPYASVPASTHCVQSMRVKISALASTMPAINYSGRL